MTRRLVLSYLGLALLILVLLEIPLAVLGARHEHGLTAAQAAREASGLAAVAIEDLEHGRLADLTAVMAQYQSRTGEEVAIIDPAGTVIASSDRDRDNDATGAQRSLVQAALSGRSVTSFSSDEGQPWADATVPISADGQPQGLSCWVWWRQPPSGASTISGWPWPASRPGFWRSPGWSECCWPGRCRARWPDWSRRSPA